jgi:hypothetical protein
VGVWEWLQHTTADLEVLSALPELTELALDGNPVALDAHGGPCARCRSLVLQLCASVTALDMRPVRPTAAQTAATCLARFCSRGQTVLKC